MISNLSWVTAEEQPHKIFKVDWFWGYIYTDKTPRRYAPELYCVCCLEVDGTGVEGTPKEDLVGLCQEWYAKFWPVWRDGTTALKHMEKDNLGGGLANSGLPGEMVIKKVCVCVYSSSCKMNFDYFKLKCH